MSDSLLGDETRFVVVLIDKKTSWTRASTQTQDDVLLEGTTHTHLSSLHNVSIAAIALSRKTPVPLAQPMRPPAASDRIDKR